MWRDTINMSSNMGIVNWFVTDVESEDCLLTRDLLSVAVADKEIGEQELATIREICKEENISDVAFMDSIRETGNKPMAQCPNTLEGKKRYLLHLVKVMAVDGNYSALEMHIIEVVAKRLGVSAMQLLSFILDDIKEGNTGAQEGIITMDCLVKHLLTFAPANDR